MKLFRTLALTVGAALLAAGPAQAAPTVVRIASHVSEFSPLHAQSKLFADEIGYESLSRREIQCRNTTAEKRKRYQKVDAGQSVKGDSEQQHSLDHCQGLHRDQHLFPVELVRQGSTEVGQQQQWQASCEGDHAQS